MELRVRTFVDAPSCLGRLGAGLKGLGYGVCGCLRGFRAFGCLIAQFRVRAFYVAVARAASGRLGVGLQSVGLGQFWLRAWLRGV